MSHEKESTGRKEMIELSNQLLLGFYIKVDPEIKDEFGNNLLHATLKNPNIELDEDTLKLAITDNNSKLEEVNKDGMTPLMVFFSRCPTNMQQVNLVVSFHRDRGFKNLEKIIFVDNTKMENERELKRWEWEGRGLGVYYGCENPCSMS